MATRIETRQIRLAQWRKIIQQKAESGLSAKEFCAIINISKDAYNYWKTIPQIMNVKKNNNSIKINLKK